MPKPKKATRIEAGILLAVVWLSRDKDDWTAAAELAKTYGVANRDVSDHAEFDRETFARLNEHERCNFHLGNKDFAGSTKEIRQEDSL